MSASCLVFQPPIAGEAHSDTLLWHQKHLFFTFVLNFYIHDLPSLKLPRRVSQAILQWWVMVTVAYLQMSWKHNSKGQQASLADTHLPTGMHKTSELFLLLLYGLKHSELQTHTLVNKYFISINLCQKFLLLEFDLDQAMIWEWSMLCSRTEQPFANKYPGQLTMWLPPPTSS